MVTMIRQSLNSGWKFQQENKYLIVTSRKSVTDIQFVLNDLKSRTKNFIIQNIEKPDDELIFALLLKSLSDRQILMFVLHYL